jgi:rhodanese-related sulfurtransferase
MALTDARALRIVDVCLPDDYDPRDWIVPRSVWRDARLVDTWSHDLEVGARVVVLCAKGRKISQAVASDLRRRGIDATVLAGGVAAWEAAGLPRVRKHLGIGARGAHPSRWVTRVAPKIDRIACPWLIARFIDPAAEFHFVEAPEVAAAAAFLDAVPYDVEGVEITHRGAGCSFDALLDDFAISDLALDYLRLVVRGADTARLDLAPEAAGLLAASLGISARSGGNDHVALAQGFAFYDALYAWRRIAASETHNWPAQKV